MCTSGWHAQQGKQYYSKVSSIVVGVVGFTVEQSNQVMLIDRRFVLLLVLLLPIVFVLSQHLYLCLSNYLATICDSYNHFKVF